MKLIVFCWGVLVVLNIGLIVQTSIYDEGRLIVLTFVLLFQATLGLAYAVYTLRNAIQSVLGKSE